MEKVFCSDLKVGDRIYAFRRWWTIHYIKSPYGYQTRNDLIFRLNDGNRTITHAFDPQSKLFCKRSNGQKEILSISSRPFTKQKAADWIVGLKKEVETKQMKKRK